jgi:hypothetical protein
MREQDIFINDFKPVMDILTPVSVETWRAEKLFTRSRFIYKSTREIVEVSIGIKMKICQSLISKWFDAPRRSLEEKSYATAESWQMRQAERRFSVKKVISDACESPAQINMFISFVLAEKPVSSHYFCQKHRLSWPQFRELFNAILMKIYMEE